MDKLYTSLGLMSGTSMDGVDASIIKSDGMHIYSVLFDKFYPYNTELYSELYSIRDKILNEKDLTTHSEQIKIIERKITIFHANIINKIHEENNINVDFIGFHGQTIFHSGKNKISKQLGDGNLLSQLTKKIIIYDFRQNDIKNGGQGAPLAPIFHKLITENQKIKLPVCILNIGGISNATIVSNLNDDGIISKDLGPGNCLIDEWMRKNKKGNYDNNGIYAELGKTNHLMLNHALDIFDNKIDRTNSTYDIKDFDINFLRGISVEDGASTHTEFTAKIIITELIDFFLKHNVKINNIFLCGGGRKNSSLLNNLKKNLSNNISIKKIDELRIDGDFIESQAFAYLAIRSFLKLPISYPQTTGCIKACTGGLLSKNF